MEKRVGAWGRVQRWTLWVWGEGSGIDLSEAQVERNRANLASPQVGMPQGSCTIVKTGVREEGGTARPTALNLTSLLPPHFWQGPQWF